MSDFIKLIKCSVVLRMSWDQRGWFGVLASSLTSAAIWAQLPHFAVCKMKVIFTTTCGIGTVEELRECGQALRWCAEDSVCETQSPC